MWSLKRSETDLVEVKVKVKVILAKLCEKLQISATYGPFLFTVEPKYRYLVLYYGTGYYLVYIHGI